MRLQDELLLELSKRCDFFSGERLATQFGVSRQAIHKAIVSLEEEGYRFEKIPRHGYKLLSGGIPDFSSLSAKFSGISFRQLDEVDSTNAVCHRLYLDGERNRTVVFSRKQTQGRGRHDADFPSPVGKGLYFSFLDFPTLSPDQIQGYAKSLHQAIADSLGCERREQRLYRNGIDAGGILIELMTDCDRVRYAVIGVGLYLAAFSEEETELSQKLLSACIPS
jgi:BirA family biotin operon repressor/biotin-[acetyl-CoA-carboxylase] ligase